MSARDSEVVIVDVQLFDGWMVIPGLCASEGHGLEWKKSLISHCSHMDCNVLLEKCKKQDYSRGKR